MNDPIQLTSLENEGIEQAKQDVNQALRDDPLLIVRSLLTENETLRTLAKRSHMSFIYSAIVSSICVCGAIWGFSRDTEYRYFFINSKGHVYETAGMTYPTATYESVINFANEVATGFHTWTYKNYLQKFPELRKYCYQDVIGTYFRKLEQDGIFAAAGRMYQHYDGLATGARVIEERPVDSDGRKAFRVELTVNEDITGTMDPVSNDYTMTIDVEQVPLSVSPQGLMCVRVDENYKAGK